MKFGAYRSFVKKTYVPTTRTLSINDATVSESAGTISFLVTLSAPHTSVVSVDYAASSNTATMGADFTAGTSPLSGTLSFSAGQVSKTITLNVTLDAINESLETFFVNLSNPVNAVIADGLGIGSITNISTPTVTSVAAVTSSEGTNLSHLVTLSATTFAATDYSYSLAGGTATSGVDYSASPTFSNGVTRVGATLTVPSGVSSFNVIVSATPDGVTEGGETYNLSIGGVTGIGTIVDSSASLITPSLTVSRNSGVAPLAVFFDATGTTASAYTTKPLHHIKYRWVVNGVGTETWAYGVEAGTSMKRVMHGAIAAYCFRTPGTYTVELQASFRLADGSLDYTTLTSGNIVVDDPDVVFAGSATIAVANGSLPVAGVGGVPAEAQCFNYSTWAQVEALSHVSGRRIMLRKGDTWDVAAYTNSSASNIQYTSYGSGAKPHIRSTVNEHAWQLLTNTTNWSIAGLQFSQSAGASITPLGTSGSNLSRISVIDCDQNGGGGLSVSTVNEYFVENFNGQNFIGGTGRVGLYAEFGQYIALLGCNVYNASNIEHNIRLQGCLKIAINNNSLYAPAATKQAITIRGRSNQSIGSEATWSGVWCEQVYIHSNDIDSGNTSGYLVEFAPQNGLNNERVRDVIFERNYLHGDIGTMIVSEAISGCTIRNNIFRNHTNDGTYPESVILVLANSQVGVPPPTDHEIYNNTCYKVMPGNHFFTFVSIQLSPESAASGATVWPTGTALQNNLVYAPGSTANEMNGLGYGILIGRRPYAGGADNWTLTTNSSDAQLNSTVPGFTIPPTTLASWKPTSGYAIGGGTYHKGAFEDFFQTPYTGATREIGAVHA